MNEDTYESAQGALCCGLIVLLVVLFCGLSGCDQISGAGVNPALAAEVEVETERLKLESDNQPVLPDDLGGAKETPEQAAPVDTRPVMYVYSPPAAPDPRYFYCRFCEQMKADADVLPVRCVFREAPDWVAKWVDEAPNVRGYPVLHYYAQGNWKLLCGYEGKEKFAAWCGKPLLPKKSAPEVATQRPFSESWRQNLPREAWRVRNLVHTDCESASLALPTTVLHLKEQSIQFSDSRESRLNRWFSVYMPPGNVTHSGSTVTFSAPPELRLHILAGGKGVRIDDLRSIEFVPGGANFHLGFGTIPFRVR